MTGSDARSPARLQRLRVTRARRLDELDRSAFEELAAGASLMVSWPYLRAVEADPKVDPSYLLATDGEGRLVGVLPCYLWDGGPVPALDYYDPVEMGGRWLLGTRARAEEWRPTMFLGTRSGYVNEWLVHPSWRPRIAAVLRPLLQAALQQAREQHCGSVAAMWLTAGAAGDLVETIPVQDRILLGSGSAALEIDFDSFDGYLAGLRPSRRHTVRRDRARFAASSLTVTEARLSECCRDLARLAAPLQEKYGHRLSVRQLEADFRRQARELDSCSWVLLCQRQGRPVGFTLFYRWGEVLYGRAAGFDYAEVEGTAAYFNLAFYLPIE
ncbi:MAG: peptidogalycan biosysnthesis protein [Candidatus Dormibacteria bacterium]